MIRRSRFFLNSFLRFAAAAGFPVVTAASGAAFFCCSFGTIYSIPLNTENFTAGKAGALRIRSGQASSRTPKLALLAQDLLLRRDRAAPRTLTGACVSMRSLAAHRQVPAVPDPAVGLDFDQPADIHLNLLAEIAFHTAFFFDFLAQMVDFIFRQVANLLCVIDIRLGGELLRALLPDAIDRGQPDPKALLRRKIYTCDTCHAILLKKSLSLTLLVLRVDANHPHHAAPMNHLALVTNLFNRCPYFHAADSQSDGSKDPPLQILLVAIHNPATRQIVRRKLHRDLVTSQNPNEILAHLAGNVRQDLVLVFQLNAKHRVGQRFNHRGHDFNGVLLGISGVAFLFFLANRSRHSLPCLFHRFNARSLQLLPRRPGHFSRSRQNPRPVSGNCHGVLEMRRGAAIRRFRHPLVAHANFRAAGIHHRLDGDDHAFLQPRAASRVTVVRQVGLVVHPRADAVPDELPHHRKTVLLHPTLHRVADIPEPVARPHLVDRAIQRFAGYIDQLLHFRPNLPHRNSHRRIPVVAVHFHPEINRDDIALAQLPLRRRNPVNDLAVHRRAQHAGITAVTLERRLAWPPGDFFLGKLLEVHRRDSRLYRASQRGQDFVNDKPGAVHLFQLFRAPEVNRHQTFSRVPFRTQFTGSNRVRGLYRAPRTLFTLCSTCWPTSSTLFAASITCNKPRRP